MFLFGSTYEFKVPEVVDILEEQSSERKIYEGSWLVLTLAMNQNLRELGNHVVRPRQARGTWG